MMTDVRGSAKGWVQAFGKNKLSTSPPAAAAES